MTGRPEDKARQRNRIRTGLPAEILVGERAFPCEVRNISRAGVLLVGDLEAPSTESVRFVIKPPTGSLDLHLSGRIVRVEADPDGAGRRIAIELVDLDEPLRDALEAFLARVLETPTAGPFDRLKPGATPPEIRKALEAIPLTQRISLSARAGQKEREVLRWDTHAAVLDALVHNSNLTIVEARALAASAHLTSGSLDALVSDPRFKADVELRMAVAVHPRVSMTTAEKAIADFKPPQIKKLMARPGLNQILREKLIRRTTQR